VRRTRARGLGLGLPWRPSSRGAARQRRAAARRLPAPLRTPRRSPRVSGRMTPKLDAPRLRLRHVRFGWTSLFVFVVLGAVLEGLHGFKVDWYLRVGNEARRFLWRL